MKLLVDKGRPYKRYLHEIPERIQLANNGLQWVTSSNVSAVGVNDNDLIIRFHNGSLYEYPNQAKLFDKMLASNSKGHFVWVKLRKPKVAYRKIGSLPFKDDRQVTDEEIFSLVDNQGLQLEQRLREMGMFIPNLQNDLLGLLSLN